MTEWKTITAALIHPIDMPGIPGAKITELKFREPDAEALEMMEEAGLGGTDRLTIKQVIAGLQALLADPPDKEIVRKLHRDDLTKLAEVIGPLLAGSPISAGATA